MKSVLIKLNDNKERIIIITLIFICSMMLYHSTVLWVELETIKHCIGVYYNLIEDIQSNQFSIDPTELERANELMICTLIVKYVGAENLN